MSVVGAKPAGLDFDIKSVSRVCWQWQMQSLRRSQQPNAVLDDENEEQKEHDEAEYKTNGGMG